jgi:predicted nuclease with TOPRIM domain
VSDITSYCREDLISELTRLQERLHVANESARQLREELNQTKAQLNLIKKYPAKCDDGLREIVDFVEMERIEQERDQFREELEKAREQLSAQTNTITALCLAIDPDCKHGPETVKLADYAIKTRKLALDIATNPLGNLNYVASKQKEIRQHLDFQHTVNGGIANE